MNALTFLLTMTMVFGLLGAIVHHGLNWGDQTSNQRTSFFYYPSLGLAFIILIVIGLGTLGIRTDSTSLLISVGGMGLAFLILLFDKARKHPVSNLYITKEYLAMGLITLVLLFAKLAEIHSIFVPNWVDGLIHVDILQKLVLKGYVPADRIYHTGFHAAAMFAHAMFRTSLPNTVLWLGQWSGLLAGFSFYDFLRRNKVHFLFAFLGAVLYGSVILFPSYLIAWGRYPFLLGLALMFPTTDATLRWLKDRQNYLEALILLCALALVHYGSVLIWFAFFVSYFLFSKKETYQLPARLFRFALLTLPPLVLLVPKGLHFLGQKSLQAMILGKSGNPDFGEDIQAISSLIQKHDLFFLLLVFVVTLTALGVKWKPPVRLAVWPIIILLLVWVQYTLVGFSVTSYINTLIFASGPIIAWFVLALQHVLVKGSKLISSSIPIRPILISILLLTFTVSGIFSSWNLISTGTMLFNSEDFQAMKWIQTHTPSDATFMIQSFIWGNKLMPSDGGGWIPILTGRKAIYPNEIGSFYDLADYVTDHDVNYIYLGKEFDPDFTLRLEDINIPYQVMFHTENVMILQTNIP